MAGSIEKEVAKESGGSMLAEKQFRGYFCSHLLVSVGDGFFGVLVSLLAVGMDASPSTLGLIAFCITFPRGALGILGGAIVDRYPRKQLMVFCDAVRVLGVFLLASLVFFERLDVFTLSLVGSLVMSTYAVSKPASKTLLPAIIDETQLFRANGLVQGMTWPAFFVGGGLLAFFSLWSIAPATDLFICASIYLTSQMLLIRMGSVEEKNARRQPESVLLDLKAGLAYLLTQRPLMVRISSYFFYTACWRGVIQVALPVYTVNVLKLDVSFYSVLMVACGIGELLSAFAIGRSFTLTKLKFAFFGEPILAFALLIAAFASLPSTHAPLIAIVACLLIGLSASMIDLPLVNTIQAKVPNHFSGKIFSYWSALGALGGSFGTLLVSGLLKLFGFQDVMSLLAAWLAAAALLGYVVSFVCPKKGGVQC